MSLFRFVQWIREGRKVHVFGDGRQERDFTYVDDVARGTVAGLQKVGYEIVNLGSDEPHLLIDAVRMIEELTGCTADIEYSEAHKADVRATWANIDKAASLLGWRPRTDFREGVRKLVEWYEANREWASQIETGR
jgi:nucleoside-diphosphate-sugar epimerase